MKGHPLFFQTKAVNILVSGVHADHLLSDCVDVNCQELSESQLLVSELLGCPWEAVTPPAGREEVTCAKERGI